MEEGDPSGLIFSKVHKKLNREERERATAECFLSRSLCVLFFSFTLREIREMIYHLNEWSNLARSKSKESKSKGRWQILIGHYGARCQPPICSSKTMHVSLGYTCHNPHATRVPGSNIVKRENLPRVPIYL